MLDTGIKAPEFTLPNQDGEEVSLKDFRGKKVMGVVRTTYLIGEEGMIEKTFGKVKAADNPAQMLAET